MQNLIALIGEERKKKGITQKTLAEVSGISIKNIRGWEQGRNGITLENADKVFKALGVSVTIGKETNDDL